MVRDKANGGEQAGEGTAIESDGCGGEFGRGGEKRWPQHGSRTHVPAGGVRSQEYLRVRPSDGLEAAVEELEGTVEELTGHEAAVEELEGTVEELTGHEAAVEELEGTVEELTGLEAAVERAVCS